MTEKTTLAPAERIDTPDAEPMRRELARLDALPIATLSINSLLLDMSPRQGGENGEHTRVLAESEEQLPPIVVHHPSMQVIDGIHRVRAAIMRGEKTIAGKLCQGTDDDAFVLAVRMNIAHGLPLTRSDRTAAAIRIIQSHPLWSDRMIATAVGLSPGTVAKARQRSTAQNMQSTTRLGKDGRVRPLNHAAHRDKVAALLADNVAAILADLKRDPSLAGETAQSLVRCLDRYRVELPWANKIIEKVPSHRADSVAQLAREYARIWAHVAAQLANGTPQHRTSKNNTITITISTTTGTAASTQQTRPID
ncbi:MAG: ParB N-terminal domain-containing protein [Pseudonocardiaceae bacterium]